MLGKKRNKPNDENDENDDSNNYLRNNLIFLEKDNQKLKDKYIKIKEKNEKQRKKSQN